LTLADRRPTAKLFLRELAKVKDPLIVETGCQRIDLDYGAGMSTTIFGLFLKGHGGKLISLDHESTYATFAKARTTDAGLPVEVIHTDSIFWLKNYAGPKFNAFYFDSQDTWVPGFQEHCLLEVQTAIWHFADDAIIMIDDTWRLADAWGGKGAKAVPWLISQGWKVLLDGWQVILRRDG
jgi:predicted O-methyltransferase YrrM